MILPLLETYFGAFAEKDAERRGELLAGCLTPNAAIFWPAVICIVIGVVRVRGRNRQRAA